MAIPGLAKSARDPQKPSITLAEKTAIMITQQKIEQLLRTLRYIDGDLLYFGVDAEEEPPRFITAKLESNTNREEEFIGQLLNALAVCPLEAKRIDYRAGTGNRKDLDPFRRHSITPYYQVVVIFKGWPTDPTVREKVQP